MMAQGGKVLVAKPDNLNLIPGTHMVGENQLRQVVFSPPHEPRHQGHTHKYMLKIRQTKTFFSL